jgi:hypothetical protein
LEDSDVTITPTIGRIVLFHPGEGDALHKPGYKEPRAAIVCRVWNERMVNLTVFDPDGIPHGRTSVPLVQENDAKPQGSWCEWPTAVLGREKAQLLAGAATG